MTDRTLLPIPDGLVLLTFDDANHSDLANVAPLLLQHGFGATFFVSEGLGFAEGKPGEFMTWDEIRALHDLGFEIGNHTRSHLDTTQLTAEEVRAEIDHIQRRCAEHGIPAPSSFCYPGFHHSPEVVRVVASAGFEFARRGVYPEYSDTGRGARGPAYDPRADHPLLIPTTGYAGPEWTLDDLAWAVAQARDGRIASICFHGVPLRRYHWVSTELDAFTTYMQYLADAGCTVIACRDLADYVDPAWAGADPYEAISRRARFAAIDLKCEYRVDPLGLDERSPRFSWRIQATDRSQSQTAYRTVDRDQYQSAYRVLVSSSRAGLDAEVGDKWDSGKVASDANNGIAYTGAPLRSGEQCWWKVQTWDRDGRPGTDSPPAAFEMGLLEPTDWAASWISAAPEVSAPLLRTETTLSDRPTKARCYVSGLGYYELYINGQRIGDRVLDPAITYYHNDQPVELGSRVLYATYDVTRHLRAGPNAVGLMLGHGWFSAEDDVPPSPSHREPYGDRPVARLQLEVEFDGGETVRLVSDASWRTSAGPITYNDYCHGETYDASLEQPGWCEPGFDDHSWQPAEAAAAPSGRLQAQPLPPIRVVRTIAPTRWFASGTDATIYDFGQNMTGWTRLTVSGPAGARVTIRHGHGVHPDGSLDDRSNMYSYGDDVEFHLEAVARGEQGFEDHGEQYDHRARQADTYVLAGHGSETWEPRFTLHGFRYAEVACEGGEVTVESIEARHARTSVAETEGFECSDPLLNQIHSNVTWTFACSLQGYPQDAADRSERVGWLGDPVAGDFSFTFDDVMFWSKWLDDLADSQLPSGDLPVISPLHWRRTYDCYLWYPVWKSSYPIVAWDVYLESGDPRVLERHYDRIENLVRFLQSHADSHLLTGGLGDHMEPQPDGTSAFAPVHTPAGLTSTAIYFRDAQILAWAAAVLGDARRAEKYSRLAADIRDAFNEWYFDAETANYATGSQGSNAIPLALGLVPAGYEDAVLANIVSDIQTNHDGHLSTGMLGTDALARVLPAGGRAEVFYTIATQTTFPSWGEQVAKGATTLWEAWEGETDPQLSYNMKLFGSVQKFFFQTVAGIRRRSPGYATFSVEPQVVGGLTHARAEVSTVRGDISAGWRRENDTFELDVAVPPNTRASVRVPKLGEADPSITEGGVTVWNRGEPVPGRPGVTGARDDEQAVVFDVGSGDYSFTKGIAE
ncbi:MAG: Bacterial alpha-L-rhamnosidase [Acidimicrobiaceae bacterium]|nr:Bacterial alpha-L-rhamnosidase [Acidimicrobiaceae bacterium]